MISWVTGSFVLVHESLKSVYRLAHGEYLFLDAHFERIHAQVAEQAKDLHAVKYLMGNEPEGEPEDEFEDESEAIKTED